MRPALPVLLLTLALPAAAAGQSSIFGTRGLGIPQGAVSTRAVGMGGSLALLDGLSGLNPAAITSVGNLTAGINFFQDWRTSTTPGGTGDASDPGMPFVTVVNRVKETPWYYSGSFGSLTDRDFGFVTVDTTPIGGVPVPYRDSLQSTGGTTDFSLALAYRPGRSVSVGLGFHFVTGSNRISLSRDFADTVLADVRQRSELAFDAIGLTLGGVYHPSEKFLAAATVRRDGTLNVDLDSIPAYTLTLPWSFAGSVQYRVGDRGIVDALVQYTTWGDADAELQAVGGVGAENTFQAALGAEVVTNRLQPSKLPVRVGVRTAQLPFPLVPGEQPSESGVSAGTGVRFAKGRAAVDMALERTWRSSGGGYSEEAWTLSFGITLKP